MQSFFSSDGPFLLQFLVIFLIILVLLMGAVLLFRRVAGRGLSLSAKAGQRGRQPRLGIVDIYELDRQRQLILLRRDNVEHLLLVGGPNDVVIERNIQRGAGARIGESVLRPEPAPDAASNAAPPSDASPASLEPPRQDQPLFAGPAFTLPAEVAVPLTVPLPGSTPPPVRTRALDQSLFEPEVPEPGPPPARVGASAAGRILRRTPPPLVLPRPDVASERPPSATAEVAPDVVPPSLSLPPGETRTVDPAVLSDMARQLEVALRRPSSAVTPPPGRPAAADPAPIPEPPAPEPPAPEPATPEPATPEPATPEPPAAPAAEPAPAEPEAPASPPPADPVAAAMAASQPPPPPVPPAPKPMPPAPQPMPPSPEPDAPARVAPQSAPPPPPRSDPAPPPPASAPNPFSVEEIEAEFARLLGRPLDRRG